MNRDELLRLAKETGALEYIGIYHMADEHLERFAALVAAHEREECAKVCEETTFAWTEHAYYSGCMDCARAIRARGES